MAQSLDFVEIVPDAQPRSPYETLKTRRERRPPVWMVRAAALRARTPVRSLAVGVIVLGGVLVGDGQAHAPFVPPISPVEAASPYFYEAGSPCPIGVVCAVEGRARQDMWASFNAAFAGATATSGNVWFAPATGVVYVQSLRAKQGDVTILLMQARVSRGSLPTIGPSVDELDVPLEWGHHIAPRTVIVSTQRGPWQVSATLRGHWDGHIPIAEARKWVTTAPTPD